MIRYGAQQLRADSFVLSEEDTARVNALCAREGSIERARRRLGVGEVTMDSARGFGRMRSATRAKVLEALDREEAKP